MSLLIALATAAAAVTSTAAPADAPQADESARIARLASLPASDRDIEQGLWRALETQPDRVVCINRVQTGSNVPRQTCGSLKRWFQARNPAEIRDRAAPWQLVEEIKEQRKKAMARVARGS